MTSDVYKVWADRVRGVISTTPGERLMRPTFGSNLTYELFDGIEQIPGLVEEDVASAFTQWLPDLDFTEVRVTAQDGPNGDIDLSIVYEVPNLTETQQTVDIRLILN